MSTEMKPAGPVYLAQQLAESEAENNRLRQEVQRLHGAENALAELAAFRQAFALADHLDLISEFYTRGEKTERTEGLLRKVISTKDRVINVLLDACERGGAK